jgi:hypothetical protein
MEGKSQIKIRLPDGKVIEAHLGPEESLNELKAFIKPHVNGKVGILRSFC